MVVGFGGEEVRDGAVVPDAVAAPERRRPWRGTWELEAGASRPDRRSSSACVLEASLRAVTPVGRLAVSTWRLVHRLVDALSLRQIRR